MAPKTTRSKSTTASTTVQPVTRMVRTEDERHALLVLPRDASADARIVSLINPATASSVRYFFCPQLGLHELTKVGTSRHSPRSCLIAQDHLNPVDDRTRSEGLEHGITNVLRDASIATELTNGYVLEHGHIFVATPFDPVFLLTPLFVDCSGEGYYRPADDYLDQLADNYSQMARLIRSDRFRRTLLDRLAAISATQGIGRGELVYRPQLSLLLDVLVAKTARSVGCHWPASMEDALIQKGLDIPTLPSQTSNIPDSEVPMSNATELEVAEPGKSMPEARSPDSSTIPLHVTRLMRRRVAFDFMLCSYIPPKLRPSLESLFKTNTKTEFAPLEDHLEKVKKAKAEAQALRALSDNISRKRSALDDDEAEEARAEKKRKKEDEEKRKKAETRAAKELKKVDTTGMKKLSSFFSKAVAPAKTQKASF